jgi:hypothetical protein
MVFNATFSNISIISWPTVLMVEETGENHRPVIKNHSTISISYKNLKEENNTKSYFSLNNIIKKTKLVERAKVGHGLL